MKALLLAAGLGTRLHPITLSLPKALVPYQGKPLIQHALEHLNQAGIREVIINLHHFPGMIVDFLAQNNQFGLKIAFSDESDQLLETGGALKKAAWFFDDRQAFVVRNVDVVTDLDLVGMLERHRAVNALVSLAVKKRISSRYFLFDNDMQLVGWENQNTGESVQSGEIRSSVPYAFSGIQIVDPGIFQYITETGRFTLTGLYLRLATHHRIIGYPDPGLFWQDRGKRTED